MTEEEARQKIAALSEQVADQAAEINSYRRRASECLRQYDEIYYSRTWQLMLAARSAASSLRGLIRCPGRVWRILSRPPGKPPEPHPPGPLRRLSLPTRRSEIEGWPRDQPLVTVGIPCYNYGAYLRECLDSVLASTLQDFEVIVIDDGSDDPQTLQVLEGIDHPKVRVYRHDNQGLPTARNLGAALGRGKYACSLDADDRIDPTYLEKTISILERLPHYGFCYSLVQKFGAEDGVWETRDFDLETALRLNYVPAGAVFRKEAWVEAKGFRTGMDFDDWNFWLTLAAKGWGGCLIPEPLYLYRVHSDSMFNTTFAPQARRDAQADLVRELHAPLIEGAWADGERRDAETFGLSENPKVRAAIEGYRAGAWREEEGAVFWQRSFLPLDEARPGILLILPWLAAGGVERLALQIIEGLQDEFTFAVATTRGGENEWLPRFRTLTSWIYDLSALRIGDAGGYLAGFVEAHTIRGVILNWSEGAYDSLPQLKSLGNVWLADIVHNSARPGCFEKSVAANRLLDAHIAVGNSQAEALWRAGAARDRIKVVPTAVDTKEAFNPDRFGGRREALRRRFNLDPSARVLTYLGRLSAEKDPVLFVRAVDRIVRQQPSQRLHALIAGDGPDRLRVEDQIAACGLQDVVQLLGNRDDVAEILAASDYLFLTSQVEGSPINLLEAMSMGLVVISTDIGNVSAVIEDGVNGFLASRDPDSFASRFERAEANPELRAGVQKAARATVRERFDVTQMVERYREILRQGLGDW